MARFRRDEDDRDEYRPARSGGNTTAIIVLALVGGFALVLVVLGVGAMFLFASQAEVREARDAEEAQAEQTQRVTYEEFTAKLKLGWTAEQVIAAVGRPTRREKNKWEDDIWHYDRAVRDSLTSEVKGVRVKFLAGKVDSIKIE